MKSYEDIYPVGKLFHDFLLQRFFFNLPLKQLAILD